jgi:hypothetical protein
MKQLELEQLENIEGGLFGNSCGWNIAGLVFSGITVATTGGVSFLLASGVYIIQIRDTSVACFGTE